MNIKNKKVYSTDLGLRTFKVYSTDSGLTTQDSGLKKSRLCISRRTAKPQKTK